MSKCIKCGYRDIDYECELHGSQKGYCEICLDDELITCTKCGIMLCLPCAEDEMNLYDEESPICYNCEV